MIHKLINILISKIKGEKYSLDQSTPLTYMFEIIITRILMIIKGFLIFRKFKIAFVGKRTSIKCVKNIKFGKGLSIDRDCYVDALSSDGIVVGRNFSLGKKSAIECSGSIKNLGKGFYAGNNVGIGSFSFIGSAGGVSIGDDTIIGNFVSFHSENHNSVDN